MSASTNTSHPSSSILINYIQSYTSNEQEKSMIPFIWKHCMNLRRKKLNFINTLSIDALRHISTFLSINDYAFNLLQVNKKFNQLLSPYKSPNIMRELLLNQDPHDYVPNMDRYNDEKDGEMLSSIDIKQKLEEWEIIGTFSWQNKNRIQYKNMSDILDIMNKEKLKYKSLYSSLYILNFMYKCRYNKSITKNCELRQLLLQSICNGGGLGFGHMVIFYYNEFFIDELRGYFHDEYKNFEKALKIHYEDGTVHGLFVSLYCCYRNYGINCKSKYSLWSDKLVRYYIFTVLFHSSHTFKMHHVFELQSYKDIYA